MEEIYKVFTASDGTDIRYLDIGSGKPLVYIHGYGSGAEPQLPVLNKLKEYFRCICFDQRGWGKTLGNGDVGVVQSAKDARELIEHLQLEDVVLAGYSMGAAVVFSYVEQFGCKHLERVIICDMTPKIVNEGDWHFGLYQGWYTREQYEKDLAMMEHNYDDWNLYTMREILTKQTPQKVRDFQPGPKCRQDIKDAASIDDAILDMYLNVPKEQRPTNIRYWKSMSESDFRNVLSKITVPALIIYADPGSCYEPRTAKYMSENIPNASMHALEGCSHMAKSEKPEEFTYAIKTFCEIK